MKTLALDTETNGIDLAHGAKPFLITVYDGSEASYWEAPVNPLTREPKWSKSDLGAIRHTLETADKLILQNPKFDAKALDTIGIQLPWEKVEDTLVMSHILASNQPHDLTSLALVYLGMNIQPLEDEMESAIKEGKKLLKSLGLNWRIAKAGDPCMPSVKESSWKSDMWLPMALAEHLEYPEDHPWRHVTANYANTDTTITYHLFNAMMKRIKQRKLEAIYQFRLSLLPAVYRMESRGVTLSEKRSEEFRSRLEAEAEYHSTMCVTLSGVPDLKLPVNGANNALKEVIFNRFQLESPGVTAKGAPSLDKNALEYWQSNLDPESDACKFVGHLLKYRKRQTGLGFLRSYSGFWIDSEKYGGRVKVMYASFNPTGTDTLRFASQNPNLQQLSKQDDVNVRFCFGPAPDREWWSMDAKNIELRLPAYESGEEELISLFERPDDSPYYGSTHLLNFHTVYPDLWDSAVREVGEDKAASYCKKTYASTWYQWCKNGGFAIQYGAVNIDDPTRPDEWGTADRAFRRKGSHTRLESRFSKLKKLNRKWIDFANKHGYVETMPDKTVDPIRGYPLFCGRNSWNKVRETVPLSYHVQGTAMWWMCKSMIRVDEYLNYLNSISSKGYFLIMQVHDELVFDFPRGTGSEPWKTNLPKIRKIQKLMEQSGHDIGVPTPVGCEYHANNLSISMAL